MRHYKSIPSGLLEEELGGSVILVVLVCAAVEHDALTGVKVVGRCINELVLVS